MATNSFKWISGVTFLALVLTMFVLTVSEVQADENFISSPDTFGNVGANSSLVLDSNGYPVISYYDDTNGDLKLMHCNDPNCVGHDESISSPDTENNVGGYPSLVLDSNGFPVISYFDFTRNGLKVLHCNDPNCVGIDESLKVINEHGIPGLPKPGVKNNWIVSMVLDRTGSPVISYSDHSAPGYIDQLVLYHCDDPNCANFQGSVPDGDLWWDDILFPSPTITSLVLDSNGYPVIVYWDNGNMNVLHCNDPICSGDDESNTIHYGYRASGWLTSLKLDRMGYPVISFTNFVDNDNSQLLLMHCNDPDCTGGDESITLLDTDIYIRFPSLALDSNSFPVVSYFDYTNGDLKLIRCNDPNCASNDKVITSPDIIGVVGETPSLELDSSDYPVISYYDSTNGDLKVIHCVDPNCTGEIADLNVQISDSIDPVNPGNQYSYILTVFNYGPFDAQNVLLKGILPLDATYLSDNCGLVLVSPSTLNWDIGILANGESTTCEVTVTAPDITGLFTNQASVSSETHDPIPENNSVTEETLVVEPLELPIPIAHLGTLGGSESSAIAINEFGQVIGNSDTLLGERHVFIWNPIEGIYDIGTLGGSNSQAFDINHLGFVVGNSDTMIGERHGFYWQPGEGMQDIGTLGGNESSALDINYGDQVVGWSLTNSGNAHAFYWDNEIKIKDLGTLGGNNSFASAVNDKEQVVGHSTTSSGDQHAFLWTLEGGMQDLGTLGRGGDSIALSINEFGQVTGVNLTPTPKQYRAFSWTQDQGMQDLGDIEQGEYPTLPAGGIFSWPNSMNNHGHIVGKAITISGDYHAFLWTPEDGMQDLGTLGGDESQANYINELGQVVGFSQTVSGEIHAFLWTEESGMLDLDTLGGMDSEANAINDVGQVVGSSMIASGAWRATLWTAGIDTDGIPDALDNAPNQYNPDQSDIDGDGIGDVADPCPNDPQDLCDPNGSGSGYIDPDKGGMVSTPDGSTTIEIPPDALPDGTSVSITDTDSGSSGFELTTNLGSALGVFSFDLQPPLTFDQPVTITFSWPDEDNDGWVDGTNAKEENLLVTKDNVAITGKCKVEPAGDGVLPDCDTDANTFIIEVSSWSQFVLAYPKDTDADGIADNFDGDLDNCLTVANSDQTDSNNDGQGDACDPVVTSITAPFGPVRFTDQPVSVSGSYVDADDGNNHFAEWDWGDTTQSIGTVDQDENSVSGSHIYSEPGVYTLKLTVTDGYPASDDEIFEFIVVYDSDTGFVTGGGWIDSPEGAYVANLSLTGKANFGFVSKYKKGANVPTGNTEFQFKVANLDFQSSDYEWLVVNMNGTRAQYKGTGTINEMDDPNGAPYKFMLWAGDSDPDKFRIKIWYDEGDTENVVYDNGFEGSGYENGQPIGSGSIVIHTKD